MPATAASYAWFDEDRPTGLDELYCLTLARGLTPAEFLARIGARPQPPRLGLAALFEPSMEMWSDEHGGESLFIGVTSMAGDDGDWALGVEVNGFLGVTEQIIVPASAGTRLVSHYSNNGPDQFYWIEDSDTRLHFNPLEPAYREGSMADTVEDLLAEVGFDFREDKDNAEYCTAAAFALAERLTGVRVTAELLEESAYACGIVTVPQG
jgi:Family of unknown function (DUF6461)